MVHAVLTTITPCSCRNHALKVFENTVKVHQIIKSAKKQLHRALAWKVQLLHVDIFRNDCLCQHASVWDAQSVTCSVNCIGACSHIMVSPRIWLGFWSHNSMTLNCIPLPGDCAGACSWGWGCTDSEKVRAGAGAFNQNHNGQHGRAAQKRCCPAGEGCWDSRHAEVRWRTYSLLGSGWKCQTRWVHFSETLPLRLCRDWWLLAWTFWTGRQEYEAVFYISDYKRLWNPPSRVVARQCCLKGPQKKV